MCRGSKESWCGSRGVRYASKGNEGAKIKGKTQTSYHYRMEEFDNLKMEHAFMKTELLIYQKKKQEEPS
jgi:hypothetical protein